MLLLGNLASLLWILHLLAGQALISFSQHPMLAASEFGCKAIKDHSVRIIINRQFKSGPLESRTEVTLGACTLQFGQT